MLKFILLGFLNYKPMTGYELKSMMDDSTMHFWHAYHSQIYTTLRKLEAEGLLDSVQEDGDDKLNRRTYTITGAGRDELTAWLDTTLTAQVAVKEDLLVRLFFSALRDKDAVLTELRLQRQLHEQKLEYYHNLSADSMNLLGDEAELELVAPQIPFWTATLRFGVGYEQMYLQWLDDTIQMIEEL
ncbi:MAG: PadR family transcriptional regulator [Aggregatilineales bacterium]